MSDRIKWTTTPARFDTYGSGWRAVVRPVSSEDATAHGKPSARWMLIVMPTDTSLKRVVYLSTSYTSCKRQLRRALDEAGLAVGMEM